MILRRITEHVKAQNWFAVGLDFVIVVAGVFVGIQVSNWNDARRDRIDERLFLSRLHDDLQNGEELTARLLTRRLLRADDLIAATDVIFRRPEQTTLSAKECEAIATAHYYNLVPPEISSVVELISSGRMAILRDAELRTALTSLQQRRDALILLIDVQSPKAADLPSKYPELIQSESFFSANDGEVISRVTCDVSKMRENQNFLNDLSSTSDRYDAFIRDGLAPWSAQFERVRGLIDAALGVKHEPESRP